MESERSTDDARRREARLNRAVWAVSGAVLLLVGLMRRVKIPSPVDFGFLPPFHAALNGASALLLVGALVAIRRREVALHRRLIYAALCASALFLLSYVAYHFTKAEVLFGDADHDGALSLAERAAVSSSRPAYLVVLATHVSLAAAVLPLVLLTFTRAYTQQFEPHRRIARWVMPLWLYVAVTGPVCYLMLRPYYP